MHTATLAGGPDPASAPLPAQATRQAASQLESQLAAAREAARLELAVEQRRQASLVEALRKELQQAKQERNRAEYERDVLHDKLGAAPQAQQPLARRRRLHQQEEQQQDLDEQQGAGEQQQQQQQWEEPDGLSPLPHSATMAQQLQGGGGRLGGAAEPAAGEHGAELLGGEEDAPVLSPGIAGTSMPAHISRPLAAPCFAGKSGAPDSFMGVGSFGRGGVIRQGPDGRGGHAKALAPITNTAKRVPGAFVSGSGATTKKSKRAKLGAAAGTASIQSFFGRAV
jgi:hypothetical protein